MAKSQTIDSKNIERVLKFLALPTLELYYGVRFQLIPAVPLLMISNLIVLLVLTPVDEMIFSFFGVRDLYPSLEYSFWIFLFLICFSPFVFWGFYQAIKTQKLKTQLERAFKVAGLINNLQKMPALISDQPIDSATKKLRPNSTSWKAACYSTLTASFVYSNLLLASILA